MPLQENKTIFVLVFLNCLVGHFASSNRFRRWEGNISAFSVTYECVFGRWEGGGELEKPIVPQARDRAGTLELGTATLHHCYPVIFKQRKMAEITMLGFYAICDIMNLSDWWSPNSLEIVS